MIARHSNFVPTSERAEVYVPRCYTLSDDPEVVFRGALFARPVICPDCRRHRTDWITAEQLVAGVAKIRCRGCAS